MKIYLADFYWGRFQSTETSSLDLRISRLMHRYPYVLESYHYMKPFMVEIIRQHQRAIFLDSGAFSMFTQGVKVDLPSYARFIQQHDDIVHVASNLDAIGAGNEQVSYDRLKQLRAFGVDVKPVHHVRDHDDWLRRYLDEGHDYICLGGMVPESTQTLTKWLDHVWHNYLTNPDGSPKVKVHGFGMTTPALMLRYPWYSLDSTSWVMHSRMGGIFLDMPQSDGTVKDYKIDFSPRSCTRPWYFAELRPAEKKWCWNASNNWKPSGPSIRKKSSWQKSPATRWG